MHAITQESGLTMIKPYWCFPVVLLVFSAHALDLNSLGDTLQKAAGGTSANTSPPSNVAVNEQDAGEGLKQALNQGVTKAMTMLGAPDGFLGNPAVKIPLPDSLKKIEKGMRLVGMGGQADELVLKMNRAAEQAVPEAKTLLVNAVKQLSVNDARGILTGPQDAATQYFKKTTTTEMAAKFLPIVQQATARVQLAESYNRYASMGSQYGVIKKEDADINQYVTRKALDGVFLMMAKEEAAIRQDPMGQANQLLKKVFGAVK